MVAHNRQGECQPRENNGEESCLCEQLLLMEAAMSSLSLLCCHINSGAAAVKTASMWWLMHGHREEPGPGLKNAAGRYEYNSLVAQCQINQIYIGSSLS